MKAKTNAGEAELTADMVRPGMVWEHARHRLTVLGANACVERPDGSTFTERLGGESPADMGWTLLGCDPAIAAREDVERYGVAPGIDAGAHGFARLRGGGAVDVRRPENIVVGMVFTNAVAERFVAGRMVRNRAWARADTNGDCDRAEVTLWRFIGLDARYARSEDVARLCCGTAARCADYPNTKDRCTLAIGDHDTHEDIAAGTRWPAKVVPPDASKWTPIAATTDTLRFSGFGHTIEVPVPRETTSEQIANAMQLAVEMTYTRGGAPPFGTATQFKAVCHMCGCRGSCPSKSSGQVDPDALPCASCGCRWCGPMTRRAGRTPSPATCPGCGAGEAMLHDATCEVLRAKVEDGRRAAEAPLGALVAAVPEGLDPIGWRAAVLAVAELVQNVSGMLWLQAREDDIEHVSVERQVRERRARTIAGSAAVPAYLRAIAPRGPRPKPERKIGGRAVRLVVDNGSDD